MAVKPITNKQVVSTPNIRRDEQISLRNETNRGGNESQSVTPGKDFNKGYSITLKDVDTAIMSHIKDVMNPSVREANEVIKVPIMYGNEERWSNIRKRGVVRDKHGSLILPLIVMRRISVEKNTEMNQGMEHDVKRKHIEYVRGSQWSKDNRYDRFSVQTGTKPSTENFVTTMPNFVNINYEFILWTNYIEQMNLLVESFVEQNYTYWGSSTDYKFLCTTDSISDTSEMDLMGERFIKSSFTVLTKAYLLPEDTNSVVTNKISNLKRTLTPTKIVFGFEGDATDEQVK